MYQSSFLALPLLFVFMLLTFAWEEIELVLGCITVCSRRNPLKIVHRSTNEHVCSFVRTLCSNGQN